MTTVLDRFTTNYDVDSETGCWEWNLRLSPKGYGRFYVKGRGIRAHRWSYEHFVGPIADGLVIDHLCRNRACVNPDHLEPVTSRENTHRGETNVNKTHCNHGHEFTPENTRIHKGWRVCKACCRRRDRSQKAAKRAA